MLTTQDLLDYAYYRCLPQVYRDEDAKVTFVDKDGVEYKKPLYRYLQALLYGGYDLALQDIENLLSLVNPETCPAEYFPALYESFGLEYFPDIDISYHRKFLSNYGELKRRRGTYSCISYLARVLTNLETSLTYLRGVYLDEYGRHVIVNLKAKSIMDILNLSTSTYVIKRFLSLFVPYYITVHISAEIVPQDIRATNTFAGSVAPRLIYNVFPPPFENDLYCDNYRENAVLPRNCYTIRDNSNPILLCSHKQGNTVVTGSRYTIIPYVYKEGISNNVYNAGAIVTKSVYDVKKGD